MFKNNDCAYGSMESLLAFEYEFIAQFLFQLKYQLNSGCKIIYFDCSSTHTFILDEADLSFLKIDGARIGEILNYVFSENIKKIKYYQRLDLFF